MSVSFKVIVPHNPDETYHHWWFPNGWRGTPGLELRDKAGRRQGERKGYFPEWFVLACNNTQCPARAVVPVEVLTDFADAHDEAVES